MKHYLFLTLVVFFTLLHSPISVPAEQDGLVRVKLRVEWGEQTPRNWNARFDIINGQIDTANSLGVSADESSVISQTKQKVLYRPKTNCVFNSIEFQVRGDVSTQLQVFIQDQNDPQIVMKHQFALKDILTQKQILPISQTNAQLIIQQSPGDAFTLKVSHPHLVFEPNEVIEIQAFPKFLQITDATMGSEMHWSLFRARTKERIASGSIDIMQQNLNALLSEGFGFTVTAPTEGAYDLVVEMDTGHQAFAQFVVISPTKNSPSLQYRINETLPLVDELNLNGIQNHHDLIVRRPHKRFGKSLKSLLKSIPGSTLNKESSLPWSAYHLKIRKTNQPHKLVVTYPIKQQSKLGFSILEPDAAGQLVPVGVDSGVYQSNSTLHNSLQRKSNNAQSEVIFWPRVNNPIILFHSLGSDVPAEIAQIKVYELPLSEGEASPVIDTQVEKKRLVGPYLQKPLLPEIFGATQVLDAMSNRSLDDWQTFYEAGNRLASYLTYHQFNSLLMAVSADGSTIYPSKYLDPTPRYDSGVYHSTGQDLDRKDVLEMLFRIFDREHLALIPELQFSSIIPSLENVISKEPDKAVGIELVNRHGRTWRNSKGTTRGQAPYYNPLNPHVQNEITNIFSELVARYKNHTSFQGVAVQLTLNGYLQLPGLNWGYDDKTVSQFEKETGVKIPKTLNSHKFEKRYQFLTTSALPQWTKWRCQKIKELHQRLAGILLKERPDTRMIFSARKLLPSHSKDGDVVSLLNSGSQFRPVLMAMGLDFSDYHQISNCIVLRPSLYHSSQQKSSIAHVTNNHPTVDDSFKTRINGALFYHSPVEVRIPEFDQISPWQPAFTWLVSQVSPSDATNRIRYVHSISTLDPYVTFDGGWTIPFGQEHSTRSIRTQLQKLPARPFQTVESVEQPVVTRLSRGKDVTYYYLINDFPYACQATVELTVPSKAAIIHLANGEVINTIESLQGTHKYSVSLNAFDFQAFKIQDPQVQIISVDCKVDQNALTDLYTKIDEKKHHLRKLHQSIEKTTAVVLHADFEEGAARDYILAGWEATDQKRKSWTLDRNEAHSGKVSLVLDQMPGNSSLKTNEIPLNQSRYLNMSVWLKTDAKAMQVRIALEAEQNEKLKVQSAIVSVDHQWRKYLFRVKDIPTTQIKNAHILIEKLGPDKLWIDDVNLQIHQISPEDDRQMTKLVSSLSFAWNSQRYLDCYRLLESYWGQFGSEIDSAPTPSRSPNTPPVKHAERRRIRNLIRR
ncbi:family 10 glycosylhydrolase [Gimesia aquarii]|uniref:Glycosyl hydrolase-like 10 domain-containing protein n=1 Tax=Gimesia aquarii TaxID=2527964 RepID=A0A517VWW6_9PLAN|nr:family 10 glycosylhydrolase [Gimesia aquarii]QDT97488.1 hypothetical protein V144x_29630 [Gimesia aquarii]